MKVRHETECYFCRRPEYVDVAAKEGWIPFFYRGQSEIDRPVCPQCAAVDLRYDDTSGEFEEIPRQPSRRIRRR